MIEWDLVGANLAATVPLAILQRDVRTTRPWSGPLRASRRFDQVTAETLTEFLCVCVLGKGEHDHIDVVATKWVRARVQRQRLMRAPAVPVTYIWIRYGDAQPVIHDFNATTEEIPAECRRVADALANEPFSVVTYDRAERFLNNVVAPISGCLLLPSDLAGIKARALITQIRRRKLSLPIIVVGRNSDLAVAVEIVRAGATDFLEQQFSHRDLRAMIRRAMRKIS